MIEAPKWAGRTVVCIASGPSLTREDCELVRASGHPVVVTNTTFRMCPWADVVFAFDARWWKLYHEEVIATFRGRRFGASMLCENYGANPSLGLPWFRIFNNSGACTISMAVGAGAAKVILLGFDCGVGPSGETHWHGKHPEVLSDAASIAGWPKHFERVAKYAREKGVEVVNCSRATRLDCWPRAALETVL